MKRINLRNIGAAVLATSMIMSFAGCSVQMEDPDATAETTGESEQIYVPVDFSAISAKDDYYGYINGEYLGTADIMMDYENVGAMGEVSYEINDLLREATMNIVNSDEEYEYGSKEWILKHAYEEYYAALDKDVVEAHNKELLPEVKGELEKIKNAKTSAELLELAITNNVGIYPVLNGFYDYQDTSKYALRANLYKEIMGVTFEDINDYYNSVGDNADKYVDVFKALGDTKEEAQEKTLGFEYLALDLCWGTEPEKVNLLDDNAEDAVFLSDDELENIFTNISYKDVEAAKGFENLFDGWYCYSVSQLKSINEIYAEENLEALRNMMIAEYCMANSDVLGLEYDALKTPYTEVQDKDYATFHALFYNQDLSSVFEKIYIELVYDEEADKALRDMCDDIVEGYRDAINEADWLTEETRKSLIEKLDGIIFLTAKDIDVNELDTDLADCFTGNYFDTQENIEELGKKKVVENLIEGTDRTFIMMPMHEVNACYSPYMNNVTITLAIQAYPFFSKDESYGFNLAGLGGTISHEIGHAFDSEGIKYDKNGTYNPGWICNEDISKLEERNEAAVKYFETAFLVYNIYAVNGERTLGENYADLGGVEVCLRLIDNDEDLRVFFENYTSTWAQIVTVSDLKDQIYHDVHSPAYIRSNAVLACLDEFYELYDIKEGDGMYIAPENRISRWY